MYIEQTSRGSKGGAVLIVSVFLTFLLFHIGCDDDPLMQVEGMIAQGNYRAALEMLDKDSLTDVRAQRLRILALFVEGYTDEGWIGLHQALASDSTNREVFAETLLRAASIIVREKKRCRESIVLLDSCIVLDPAKKDEALKLAFQRSFEYLAVIGDTGYWLMEFTIRHKPEMFGSLRGRNPIFAKRYEDIGKTFQLLHSTKAMIERLRRVDDAFTDDMTDLTRQMYRSGWTFEIRNTDSGNYLITATVTGRHPLGIPEGTVLTLQ
ncbi:MAG: hypothetical protein P9M15_00485 [Candidatus Electryoneaceae bacterium]|nr:hypothetical protein [Candidatus Electryoneaceae bacterium]